MNLGEVSLYIKLADTKCVHQGMQQSGHEAAPCPPTGSLLCFFFILFYLFKQPHYNFPITRITILPLANLLTLHSEIIEVEFDMRL